MREETFKTNTTCNCPTACGHRDIEEFVNMTTDKCNTSTNMKRRSTNLRISDMDRLNPRTRRINHSLDSTTSNADALALCMCQQSRTFPFCDNTHVAFNRETNSSLTPLYVKIVEDTSNTPCANCGTKEGEEETATTNIPSRSILEPESPRNNVDIIAESLYRTPHKEVPPNHTPPPCTDIDYPQDDDELPPSPKYTPSSIKDKRNQQNIITKEEVAQHTSRDSLWMIIKGNVYDITTYVPSHPGGERALLKFAGRDGTENVQFHSSKMLEILNSRYFIGKLYKEEAPSRCTIC